jgi:uncharacterized membrane protein (UPF0127 family)
MIERFQIVALVVLLAGGSLFLYFHYTGISLRDVVKETGTPIMHIGKKSLRVEIVKTPEERMIGLSNRDALTGVDGMLFVFDAPDMHQIWMKDMRFPIDIIWISEDLEVISIDHQVRPDTYPTLFRPLRPARYAVETNAIFAETFDLHPGQKVSLPQ